MAADDKDNNHNAGDDDDDDERRHRRHHNVPIVKETRRSLPSENILASLSLKPHRSKSMYGEIDRNQMTTTTTTTIIANPHATIHATPSHPILRFIDAESEGPSSPIQANAPFAEAEVSLTPGGALTPQLNLAHRHNFAETSCTVFTSDNPLRRAAIRLITWKWFERLSIGVIIVNCVCLGLADPCDSRCSTQLCSWLQTVETAIFVFFFCEMLIKMLAMGVFGRQAYLGDGWNCFDCFIVLVGTTEYLFIEGDSNFSAIRAFRVFRPLRAINRIPGLRLLVTLLLDILPMLGNVLIFCFFIFFIFGIGGVQLWSGTLRHRCYFPHNLTISLNSTTTTTVGPDEDFVETPPSFMPPFYRTTMADFVCSPDDGMMTCNQLEIYDKSLQSRCLFYSEGEYDEAYYDCIKETNHESMCMELFDGQPTEFELCQKWVPHYTECRADGPNPLQGTLSFDNIGYACIAIFQVISLEGWTEIMYLMQDAYSFWVWIYFVALIMIGSQFAVNLCLVVIASQFSETKKREMSKMRLERKSKKVSLSKLSLSIGGASITEDLSIYNQVLNLIAYCGRQLYRRIVRIILPKQYRDRVFLRGRLTQVEEASELHQRQKREQYTQTPCCLKAYNRRLRYFLRQMFEHNITVGVIMGAILVNTCVMGAEHYQQPETFTQVLDAMNLFFTVFFTLELTVKLYAFGLCRYIHDGFNMLDLIIVVINLAELQQGNGSNLSVLRTFRLVRVVKLIRFLPSLQHSLIVMMRTIDNIAPFFVMLSFFLYIFALLGMSLFGCRFCPQGLLANNYTAFTNNDTNNASTLQRDPRQEHFRRCHLAVVSDESEANDTIMREMINRNARLTMDFTMAQPCPRSNFDSLLTSLFTVLQIFTQDAWSAVLKDGMRNTSEWASLYFVALVTIGNYVIFNLLVAILVEGFASESEPDVDYELNSSSRAPSRRETADAKDLKRLKSLSKKKARKRSDPPIITIQNFDNPDEELTVLHPRVSSTSAGALSPAPAEPSFFIRFTRRLSSKLRAVSERCRQFFASRSEYSLFLLAPDSKLRLFFRAVIDRPLFDNVVLVFILANCALITLERPAIKPDSEERRYLDIANYVLNFIFALEASAKIIACGMVFGKGSYLRDGWNILDFILINCSTVHTLLNMTSQLGSAETKILEIFRVLRILRALRPLRVINRAHGLKIALETLMVSIKPIGNIIIITISFFFVFAVLGLQLFKGCFHKCLIPEISLPNATIVKKLTTSTLTPAMINQSRPLDSVEGRNRFDHTFELLLTVKTRQQCQELGFDWVNEGFNFDDLANALMSLFVFATFDGWVDITRNGVDCVAPEMQPVQDYNPWRMIYFISFLLIVCFFMLNMFVGVVVNNFQKVQKRVHAEMQAKREQIRREKLLARLSKKAEPKKKSLFVCFQRHDQHYAAKTVRRLAFVFQKGNNNSNDDHQIPFYLRYPSWRRSLYKVITSRYFELAITVVTVMTMITMAMEFYRMPQIMWQVMRYIAYIFTAFIIIECVVKLVALGAKRYFAERWNHLDFFIVVSSIAGVIAEEMINVNPTMIQLIRIFRIMRVLKLLKAADGIRRLLNTVSEALPQVGNLSLLFLLLFFIYAAVGVELFGKFDCNYIMCEGLSRHANFQNFGMSLLTLFRIFTGDNWNGILKDMLTFSSDAHCAVMMKTPFSQESAIALECAIVHFFSPGFFVSFVLISQFILINVVIAVLMGSLEGSHYFERVQEQKIGEEVAEQVAALEDVVAVVCHDLVDRLQSELHAPSRQEIISLVSTEYALRTPMNHSPEQNPHLIQLDEVSKESSPYPLMGSHSSLNSTSTGPRRRAGTLAGQHHVGSRNSSVVAIDPGVLEEVFHDLGSQLKAHTGVDALSWFVETRRNSIQVPSTPSQASSRRSSARVRRSRHEPVSKSQSSHFVAKPVHRTLRRVFSDPSCLKRKHENKWRNPRGAAEQDRLEEMTMAAHEQRHSNSASDLMCQLRRGLLQKQDRVSSTSKQAFSNSSTRQSDVIETPRFSDNV